MIIRRLEATKMLVRDTLEQVSFVNRGNRTSCRCYENYSTQTRVLVELRILPEM